MEKQQYATSAPKCSKLRIQLIKVEPAEARYVFFNAEDVNTELNLSVPDHLKLAIIKAIVAVLEIDGYPDKTLNIVSTPEVKEAS
jgi:hypothetical protein